ncbi:hypothetical protein J2X02_001472 [Pseudoxanthomonas japonensis]|jgi:hypothetical protein|uniref:hypothetical protein n=1 Tax=Pseudoxanthomonas TaxID=83618 RepID=UPI000781C485|nr:MULTISPECIES: hypothetical protein [Pseudoxanthomonas]MBA3928021.1 hypothetical protein [Xanthomonas sp.]MBL8257770.1 hypothetical protein [Pseudoxanthomonas mexicana]MDR7068655.1 hypothetical protein [Pseudoxanthomonas japonensis]
MAFDVGIGKCRSVQSDSVDVWVDGSIVRRLVPETKWQRDGISVLQVPVKVCSPRHPVAVGGEVFLDTGLITATTVGKLDVDGSGDFAKTRLSLLVPTIDPTPTPPPPSRKASWR